MFTLEDRKELISIFSKLKKEAAGTLKNDNVLPSSITHNGKQVGVKIEFYELLPPPPKE